MALKRGGLARALKVDSLVEEDLRNLSDYAEALIAKS